MRCKTYEINALKNYKYVVILSESHGKIILSRHKERTTWETQGGHIEAGETPLEAAKRELFEESGAVDFDIEPICDYRAWDEDTLHGANGVVFHAVIQGNTAQSPPDGFARNLRADFPSYCPEIPCHTAVCLRNF